MTTLARGEQGVVVDQGRHADDVYTIVEEPTAAGVVDAR
jgi:hypothetical protein